MMFKVDLPEPGPIYTYTTCCECDKLRTINADLTRQLTVERKSVDELARHSQDLAQELVEALEAKLTAAKEETTQIYKDMNEIAMGYKAKLTALVEAAEAFMGEAVVLTANYLEAFESYKDDDCIQGWDKARWIRALDAKYKLKAAIEAAKVN
jgi:sulfite reductase beta subunit-like hemoprotein